MESGAPLQQLVATAYLPSTIAKLYGSPFAANTPGVTVVTGFILANVTAGAVVASLSIVPPGGTQGMNNRIMPAVTIPANTSWFENEQEGIIVLPGGYELWGNSGGASSITFTLYGREIP